MILLLGDYSSVHYELCRALRARGENVVLMSDGDSYKKIKCDVVLPGFKKNRFKAINRMLMLFRFIGFFGIKNYFIVKKQIDKIENIDVVQVINPVVIPSLGALGNLLLIRYLKQRAGVFSLCALGDDYHWVSSCLNKKFEYSPLDRLYANGVKGFLGCMYSLKYVYSPLYKYLDGYTIKNVDVIIPGLADYEVSYQDVAKLKSIIRLPISSMHFVKPKKTEYPVKIFHAWQKGKESRKGNDILDKMVNRYITEFGSDKVKYEIVSNVSYDEYLRKYKDSDIILDQVYSYDRGVTAALGMASGKVVFSGFEEGHFDIGINATPHEDRLYNDFLMLINSLDLIDKIKKSAYDYAIKNYRSDFVCEKYLNVWSGE